MALNQAHNTIFLEGESPVLKRVSNTGVSVWILQNLSEYYFEKHLRTVALEIIKKVNTPPK